MQTTFSQPVPTPSLVPPSAGIQYRSQEPLPSLSDEQLVERCRHNDRAALDVLIKRYERPIYGLAYHLTGNYDDANDIAAETFVRICRGIGTFQHAVTLRAWLNRIVVNVFHDTCRSTRRKPAISLEALVAKSGEALLAEENSTTVSPQRHAEENERKAILSEAINTLPRVQRRMIRLFHHEERSYEEIAELMDVPVGTVKSRLNRARAALREVLTPHVSVLVN